MDVTARSKYDHFLMDVTTADSSTKSFAVLLNSALDELLWGSQNLSVTVRASEHDYAELQAFGQHRLALLGFTCKKVQWDRPVKIWSADGKSMTTDTSVTRVQFNVDWTYTRNTCLLRYPDSCLERFGFDPPSSEGKQDAHESSRTAKSLFNRFLTDVRDGKSPLALRFDEEISKLKWGASYLKIPLRSETEPLDQGAVKTYGKMRLALLGYVYGTIFYHHEGLSEGDERSCCFSIDWSLTEMNIRKG